MNDTCSDTDIALMEMSETEVDISEMEVSPEFRVELNRIRLDLGVSPFVGLTDEMIKWVLLADQRAKAKGR